MCLVTNVTPRALDILVEVRSIDNYTHSLEQYECKCSVRYMISTGHDIYDDFNSKYLIHHESELKCRSNIRV